jgi:hypothetical protein
VAGTVSLWHSIDRKRKFSAAFQYLQVVLA